MCRWGMCSTIEAASKPLRWRKDNVCTIVHPPPRHLMIDASTTATLLSPLSDLSALEVVHPPWETNYQWLGRETKWSEGNYSKNI